MMNLQTVSGGASLGLFVACTPTIPFHMLLCTVGALVLRVNLPVALVGCWLTNPITAVPVYLAAARLGRHLLGGTHLAEHVMRIFRFDATIGSLMEKGIYLWAGGLIFAIVAAIAGNLLVRASWGLARYLKSTPAHPDAPEA